MKQEIADAIETLIRFVDGHNRNGEDAEAAEAASKVEAYLATYSPRK